MEKVSSGENGKKREGEIKGESGSERCDGGSWKGSEWRSETRGTLGLESASLSRWVAVSFAAPLPAPATWWHLARVFFFLQGEGGRGGGGVSQKSGVGSGDRNRFRRMVGGQVYTWTQPRVEPEALEGLLVGPQWKRNGLDCGGWNSGELLCSSPTETIASHFYVLNVEQNVIFSPLSRDQFHAFDCHRILL